ncbi:MAG: putative polysaccharide biosynthesis protein [Deltaproteobacteria bacterium]|nr:putative polysaccharide biosynthesis protein [Deltaproteobacteria bacterium]
MSAVSLRALARSSAYVNAATVWQMASRLVLTPVIITTLGVDGYGAWALIFSLCSYAMALDNAAGWVYAKLTAELDQQGDYTSLSEGISSGLVLVGGAAIAGLVVLWLARGWILPLVGVPPPLLLETEATLGVLAVAVAFEASAGGVLDVLAGLQRMDLEYRFLIFGAVAEFVTALVLLSAGVGMASLAVGVLVREVVSIGTAWGCCRRLRPMIVLSPRRASVRGVTQVVHLGMRFQSLVLVHTTLREGTRLLISGFYGTTALGFFHLADRLLSVARAPGLAIVSPLMPAFANLGSSERPPQWRRLFVRASTVLGLAAALPLFFAAVFAGPIVFGWTGQYFPDAAWTARVFVPMEFVALMMAVAAARLRAAGIVRLELTSGVIGSVLATAGLIAAYPFAGYAGSVVGVAGGRTVGALWFLMRFLSMQRVDRWRYMRKAVLAPVLVCAPICLLFGAIAFHLPVLNVGEAGRWTVLVALAVLALACALTCVPAAWYLVLSARERGGIVRLVRRHQAARACAMRNPR